MGMIMKLSNTQVHALFSAACFEIYEVYGPSVTDRSVIFGARKRTVISLCRKGILNKVLWNRKPEMYGYCLTDKGNEVLSSVKLANKTM